MNKWKAFLSHGISRNPQIVPHAFEWIAGLDVIPRVGMNDFQAIRFRHVRSNQIHDVGRFLDNGHMRDCAAIKKPSNNTAQTKPRHKHATGGPENEIQMATKLVRVIVHHEFTRILVHGRIGQTKKGCVIARGRNLISRPIFRECLTDGSKLSDRP